MRRILAVILAEVLVAAMVAGVIWAAYRDLRQRNERHQQCVDACLQEHVCQNTWACSKTCDNN